MSGLADRAAGPRADGRYNVEAVARAIDLLMTAARYERPVPLRDFVGELGLSKPTVYRLLRTLEAQGALRQVGSAGYVPGPAMITIGQAALRAVELPALARPHLEHLHGELGETVNLAVLDDDEIVIVERLEDRRILGLRLSVGSRLPAYCTSVGHVLLADLPDQEVARRLTSCRFDPLGPRTLSSLQGLVQRLAEVRQRGYAINDEELALGHRAIAAPVVGHSGDVTAAINVSVPGARVSRAELERKLAPALVRTARRISAALGAPQSPETPTAPRGTAHG